LRFANHDEQRRLRPKRLAVFAAGGATPARRERRGLAAPLGDHLRGSFGGDTALLISDTTREIGAGLRRKEMHEVLRKDVLADWGIT